VSPERALVVIDVQAGVFEGCRAPQFDDVVARIASLLEAARAAGTPVIYVQHSGPEGHRCHPSRPGWAIHPAIRPRAGEPVVHKRACDSFFETTLQEELRRRRVDHLVVVGCMTEYCVDTTCRRAVSLGYDVTLVSDAHATADTEELSAAQIIAHHNALLDGFSAGSRAIEIKPAAGIALAARVA
jgi:nicotinamidase-related amidase